MSITTSARFNMDTLLAALPAAAAVSVSGDPTAATAKTVTFTGTDDATGQAAVTTAAGQFVDRDANKATLQTQAQAALAANRSDQTQDGTIQTGAATINATAGPFNLTQCTTFIKQLASAVSTLAGNDVNAKKELNALIRLALQQFDATN